MAAGAKRSKAKWDSDAERKIIDIWADILEEYNEKMLRGSCADSAGDEERIRGSDCDSCARGERRDAAKAREGRSTTVRCPPFSLCTNEGVTDCSR